MNKDEIREVAKEVVKETLLQLGVPTEGQEDIVALQDDLRWLRKQRYAAEEISKWIKFTAIASLIGGFMYVLWEGIKLAARM